MTEQQNQLDQLKAKFEQQNADYLAKEQQLQALEAEKTKSENLKLALENEQQEIVANTKNTLTAGCALTADEYTELKTADFNIKTKLEYYQALIEEQEEKINQFKTELYEDVTQLEYVRVKIFNILADEAFFEIKQSRVLSRLFALVYVDVKYHYNKWEEKKTISEKTIEVILDKLKEMIDKKEPVPSEFLIKNIIGDFKPKSPMQLHRESKELEQGLIEPKGFKKLIQNLMK